MKNCCILIQFSLQFVPNGLTGKKPALVQIMALRRTGGKPLSEPMMAKLANVYMRHPALVS